MNFINLDHQRKIIAFTLFCSLLLTAVFPAYAQTQLTGESQAIKNSQTVGTNQNSDDNALGLAESFEVGRTFRVEKFRVAGGSEIITIFADLKNSEDSSVESRKDVPLVSVLRDTLGDEIPENDRLRYVWMLSYAEPSFAQKFASGVPFLYRRVTNKGKVGDQLPPAVMDLNPSDKDMWDKVFWMVFKNLVLSQFDSLVRASTLQFKGNKSNYRKSAMMRALAVLTLYESLGGEKILNDTELQDIQARVMLSDKLAGSFLQKENLGRVYQKNGEKRAIIAGIIGNF